MLAAGALLARYFLAQREFSGLGLVTALDAAFFDTAIGGKGLQASGLLAAKAAELFPGGLVHVSSSTCGWLELQRSRALRGPI
jgi:hypothetical protein